MMGVKSQKHMGYSLSENAGPWHKYEEFVLDLCKRKSALPKQELLEKWSLVKRLAAFNCFQRNAKLVACRMPSPFLDHETVPPRAWCSAPLYTLARDPVFGVKYICNCCYGVE